MPKQPIEDRLRASLRFGANTGDRHEQEICGNQMREAADEISKLREQKDGPLDRPHWGCRACFPDENCPSDCVSRNHEPSEC